MELSMTVVESGIRSDFLNSNNYKNTLDFASKRNENFILYCKVIRKYYSDLQNVTRQAHDKIKANSAGNLRTSAQFKQFVLHFMGIIDQVSRFKMQYYEELEEVQEDPVKKPTYQLLAKTALHQEAQNNYKDIFAKLMKVERKLEEAFALLKKETKYPVNYFDIKLTATKCSQLEELIKERQELQKKGNEILEEIYKNTEDFQRDIMFYRQKMLSGKYKVHQKLHQMSKGAKQCLVSTLLSLIDVIEQQQSSFLKMQRQSIRQSTLLQKFQKRPKGNSSNDQINLTEIIIQATKQYQVIIDDLTQLLNVLSQCLQMIASNIGQNHQSGKQVIEELNKLYENEENPTPEIIETLDLFYYFCQKLAQIPTAIHLQKVNLGKLRQNISKHSEITLSLVRCSGIRPKGEERGMNEISHLFEQLSYDYINDIIQKVFKVFEGSLNNMKNHFNAKFYKKRKTNVMDSMEISHIEEETPFIEKKPSKKEMWIWKDFRNCQKYHRINDGGEKLKEVQKQIKGFKQIKVEGGKEIQKYNCGAKSRKELKGILTINEKNLNFLSNNGANIVVPYDFVEQVIAEVNIFQKELVVKTSMGNISFLHFPQISRAQVLIQQQIEAQTSSNPGVQKKSVELTPEQIAFIKERREKVQSQRFPIEDMKQKGSLLLQNTTIDTVYEALYSDKPFKFKGKEECCYMSYVLKKGGGANYTTTPYKPPGPKFYSLEQGHTFDNTPLFSQRTNVYDVTLPPIPFMPKTAQTTEQVKIYWLSNEQFDYTFRCDSKAPMGDTFYLNFVHRIIQKEKNVEIKVYFKYTFVKDTSMKGMITSKSEEQATNNVGSFINESRKVMKTFGGGGDKNEEGGRGTDRASMQEGEEVNQSMDKGMVKKLQNQNKILIGVLVAVIVINIILRFI